MDLALAYTFTKPQLDEDVAGGKYANIRLFQYGDMGVKYEELMPTWVTTQVARGNTVVLTESDSNASSITV
jgi:hypothetical protein